MTPKEYFEKVDTMMRGAGYAPGKVPVIERHKQPALWQAWVDYFRYCGLKSTVQIMEDGASSWTVPTLDPRDFDPVTATLAAEEGDKRRASIIAQQRKATVERRIKLATRARQLFHPAHKATAAELDVRETEDEHLARLRREFWAIAKNDPRFKAPPQAAE